MRAKVDSITTFFSRFRTLLSSLRIQSGFHEILSS